MKYIFTGETKVVNGITVKRIKRLSDGLIGGWIEKEDNLSHKGDCFVYDEAVVCDCAQVFGDAKVSGYAQVSGDAWVSGNAYVSGYAQVSGDAQVYDYARVFGDAWVYGDAQVYDYARVFGDAEVYGDAQACGDAIIGVGIISTGKHVGTNITPAVYNSQVKLQPSAITCTCDMFTVMNYGCKCGGFQREMKTKQY